LTEKKTYLDIANNYEKQLKATQYGKFLDWQQMYDNAAITEALEFYFANYLSKKRDALIKAGFSREESIQIICYGLGTR